MGLFLHADIIVKLVMIGLAFAPLVTWTVSLAKWLELRSVRIGVRQDLRTLEDCPTLSQAHEQLRNGTSPTAFLMQVAGNEIRLSASLRGDGLKERIAWQLERIEQAASRKMVRGTGVLATIGSRGSKVGCWCRLSLRPDATDVGGLGAFAKAQNRLGLIKAKHQAIADSFGTGAGLHLMRTDSEMAECVLLKLIGRGIVSLPIHDSFIVEERHAGVLDEIMEEVLHPKLRSITGGRLDLRNRRLVAKNVAKDQFEATFIRG